jgi:tRNA-dihydrouridine synthase B
MLARGALGNPWLFEEVLGRRAAAPTPEEVRAELDWVMDRSVEHLGADRAGRYLRKFYPWYVERLGGSTALNERLQRTATVQAARAVLDTVAPSPTAATAA